MAIDKSKLAMPGLSEEEEVDFMDAEEEASEMTEDDMEGEADVSLSEASDDELMAEAEKRGLVEPEEMEVEDEEMAVEDEESELPEEEDELMI